MGSEMCIRDSVGTVVAINSVLEDTNEAIFRGLKASFPYSLPSNGDSSNNPVVLSSLRCTQGSSRDKTLQLRTVWVHPAWNSNIPDEDLGHALPREQHVEANGWRAVKDGHPLSYKLTDDSAPNPDRFHMMHALSRYVRAGACYPFTATLPKDHVESWEQSKDSSEGKLKLVLSTDFAQAISQEALQEVVFPVLQLASSKLQSLFFQTYVVNNADAIRKRYDTWDKRKTIPDEQRKSENLNGILIDWWTEV